MPKHKITETSVQSDAGGNKVYVLRCLCGWVDKSYNDQTLVVSYQHHVMLDNGIFPHKCEDVNCARIVEFDDEPWCFEHSPDSGSDLPGYSARAKEQRNA